MPGGGVRGQNLGHLYFGSKFWFKFHCRCISHEPMIKSSSHAPKIHTCKYTPVCKFYSG